MADRKKRVALFATEPVTGRIGGLGIRQLEAARELHRRRFEVRLITPFPVGEHKEKFSVEHRHFFHDHSLAQEPMLWADAIYTSQPTPIFLRMAQEAGKPVAVDLLALLYFEELEQMPLGNINAVEGAAYFSGMISKVRSQLSLGDFFLCSNEREKDYYLGILTMLGKLRPDEYGKDLLFNSVIDIAPFGIPRREPKRGANRMRGVMPGIGKNDFIIIWGGSMWNWYDCLTPVKAMAKILKKCPRAKLVFVGTKHPATSKPTEAYMEVHKYVTREKLLGKNVFFHSEWVPYDQHEYFLTEADAGVATFLDHIENRFSFRIRIADYMWGNLPTLTNPGNTLSGLIEEKNLGYVFPFGDHAALAERICLMASNTAETKKMKARIAAEKKQFHWDKVLQPLVQFCRNPKKKKAIFSDAPAPISFYELNREKLKRILFLRSSPMAHSRDAILALKSIAPDADIDVVVQPGVNGVELGESLAFIHLPENGFKAKDSGIVPKREYDAVVCAFNTNDLRFYSNVAAFAKNVAARQYWAFDCDYRFIDIKGLLGANG